MSRREIEIGAREIFARLAIYECGETRGLREPRVARATKPEVLPVSKHIRIGEAQDSTTPARLYLAQYRRRKRGFTAPVPHTATVPLSVITRRPLLPGI